MAQIKLKNLTKRWGDFVAVENFDLDIADEEFLVLLGPSGCGKTTTMRMIAGLEEITSGDVEIDGRIVNDLEPDRYCHGIPVLRPLPQHECREYSVPAKGTQCRLRDA